MSHLNYGHLIRRQLLVAALSVFLIGSLSTDADASRYRRDSSSDLIESLSHEASRVAEGTDSSLPTEPGSIHPPNKLGIALEEFDSSANDGNSRASNSDDESPVERPDHKSHHGSSRAALPADNSTTSKPDSTTSKPASTTSQPASTTKTPPPETQLTPSNASSATGEKLLTTLPPHKEIVKGEKLKKRKRKKSKKIGKSKKQEKAINELSQIGKKLKEDAPSVILINGRKFNQIEQTSCVDEKFYNLLAKDLANIIPHKRIDTYDTYYDYNYAKAVLAMLEAPKFDDNHMVYREDKGDVLLNGLEELRKYWNFTMSFYIDLKLRLNGRIRGEVAVHKWLYNRLEGLKSLLMKGEEALVGLNNRVRKLNKAPREQDLQQALCSCITSRSGKTVIGIMNELFVDKDSEVKLKDLERARRQGLEMAEDTASYCAYWYGDTIRTQARMKERHILGMVTAVSHNKTMVKQLQKHYKINRTIITTTKIISNSVDGNQVTEVKTHIVTKLIDMTDLWLPKMAQWIRAKLNINGPAVDLKRNSTSSTPQPKAAPETPSPTVIPISVTSSSTSEPSTFSPVPASSSPTAEPYRPPVYRSFHPRKHRKPKHFSFKLNHRITRSVTPDTTELPSIPTVIPLHPDEPQSRDSVTTTTSTSTTTTTKKPNMPDVQVSTGKPKVKKIKESKFEADISDYGEKCAKKGFSVLLSISYDQSTLMYSSAKISLKHKYIRELEKSFASSFKRLWRKKRNQWSRKMSQTHLRELVSNSSRKEQVPERSVDEEMSDSFEAVGSSYERGMKLGYMVGRFVGEKAARQWPDPAELNTFTYDSLFLAGLASGYNETATRELEQKIVTETTKRIAFTEASRQVFAKTLVSSYRNGASMVPIWGVLHGQRSGAKQAAKEGAKLGYDAAVRAASEFGPKAHKFFLTHKMQRALSSPYKLEGANGSSSLLAPPNGTAPLEASAGVSREIDQVQLEIEVHRSVSREATKCGKETGLVMGALMGLVVTPEAFESFARFRGSLEGLENEFNHFKLGALRGYQFGENAAYVNYTQTLNQNLASMKNQTGIKVASIQDAINKKAAKERELSGKTTTPFSDDHDDESLAHTDNVLQFMIVNYGPRLVANHSSKSMLKIRSQVPDESMIRQIQLEAQDYMPSTSSRPKKPSKNKRKRKDSSKKAKKEKDTPSRKKAAKITRITRDTSSGAKGSSNSTTKPIIMPPAMKNITSSKPINANNLSLSQMNELDSLFGTTKFAGALSGSLVSKDGRVSHKIKINILDMGAMLEFEDEDELEANLSSINNGPTFEPTIRSKPMESNEKLFIKLQMADTDQGKVNEHLDPLADFLNAAQTDEGDGYMCGTLGDRMPRKRTAITRNETKTSSTSIKPKLLRKVASSRK